MTAAARRISRVRPLPTLPVEAGEHDDFVREQAAAQPRTGKRRHVWLGGLCLLVLFGGLIGLCVHTSTRWVPISSEHVFPPR